MFIQLLILILGFVLLVAGANSLINGSSNIAKKYNVSQILVGLTIVSLGTTLPELMVTMISSASNNTDILVGNVIGSNLCNLFVILGITAIIKPIKFEKTIIKQNLPLLILINLLVLLMGLGLFSNTKFVFTRANGIVLLIIAFLYFALPIIQYFKEKRLATDTIENTESNLENINIFKCIIYIIVGILALKYGGDFAVNSAIKIANILNIPERIISLTIVAIGTSLPELITSIVAIIKKNEDLAEGNIIGACTINFSLNLGLGAFLNNLPITISYIQDLILLLVCCILIWLFSLSNKENVFSRKNGTLFFIIYLVYSIQLFI